MANNGRLYISHAPEDAAQCASLLTALDAWAVDYFFGQPDALVGQQLGERAQREIGAHDILLRVCTVATARSAQMNLEASAFRALQAQDQRQRRGERRFLINLILDRDYTHEPFEAATLFIEAASRPRALWLPELGRAIGVTGHVGPRRVSRRALVGYGAATAVTLGSAAVAGDLYATYHPVSAEASPTAHRPGSLLWTLAHTSPLQHFPALTSIAGSTLYTMAQNALTAFDVSRISSAGPTRLWSQSFNVQSYNTPMVVGDVVYASADTTLYAFDSMTGRKLWSASPSGGGDLFAAATVSGETVFVPDSSGALYALRGSDGGQLWRTTVNVITPLFVSAAVPVADSTTVYVGSYDHYVYALNAHDGSPRWKLLTRGSISAAPALVNGILYIGSSDNYLYALNAATGAVKWKYLTGAAVLSSPAVVDGVVYFASNDGYLYTLDAATGKAYWRAPIGDLTGGVPDGVVVTQPAVTGDSVTVMDNFQFIVRSFSRSDGATRWTYKPKDLVGNDAPIGARGVVYFSGGDQHIYAFGA